jgi:hypothetical protein
VLVCAVELVLADHRVGLVHQDRVVDLDEQARLDDRPVFLAQRVGEREHELLLARVVLVLEPVRAGRRHHREEALDDIALVFGQGRLEVRDVTVDRRAVIGERTRADPDHALIGAVAVVLGQEVRGGAATLADRGPVEGVERGVRARECLAIAARGEHAGALKLDRADLEPAHALVQIRDPARLAHLPVVGDVDPDLDLAADHVVHGCFQRAPVGVLVDRLAALLGRQERQQLSGADQASGMGRKDSVHEQSSPAWAPFVTCEACEAHAMLGAVRRPGSRRVPISARTGKARQAAVRGSASAVVAGQRGLLDRLRDRR